MKKQEVYRLFRHNWANETHLNWTFNKSVHYITMIEFVPYFTDSNEKRVKVEVANFVEEGHWEDKTFVKTWSKEVLRTEDMSRDEANAAWVKHKNVKYVTQNIPKDLRNYF